MNRGVAITALVLALQSFRPVELYAWTAVSPGYMPSFRYWPISTTPLDLSSLAFQIGRAEMHRSFAFTLACRDHDLTPGVNFPIPYGGNRDTIQAVARIAFGAEPQDLVIPRATSGMDDPLINSPFEWLREVIETHKEGDETVGDLW